MEKMATLDARALVTEYCTLVAIYYGQIECNVSLDAVVVLTFDVVLYVLCVRLPSAGRSFAMCWEI